MKNHYPLASWDSPHDHEPPGRGISPREYAVRSQVERDWELRILLAKPDDLSAVHDAVAFAYMMADIAPPGYVEMSDGPRHGAHLAAARSCSWGWRGLVREGRREMHELASALHCTCGIDYTAATNDIGSHRRVYAIAAFGHFLTSQSSCGCGMGRNGAAVRRLRPVVVGERRGVHPCAG